MGMSDLPDMYARSPWALGIHIRQITRAHVTTINCSPTIMYWLAYCTIVLTLEKVSSILLVKSQTSPQERT